MTTAIELAYLFATGLFVLSLHWMGDPKTARRGVHAGMLAMLVAVLATWAKPEVSHHSDFVRHAWVIIPIVLPIWPAIWLTAAPSPSA